MIVRMCKRHNHSIPQALSEALLVQSSITFTYPTTVIHKGDGVTPWWAFWKAVECFFFVPMIGVDSQMCQMPCSLQECPTEQRIAPRAMGLSRSHWT